MLLIGLSTTASHRGRLCVRCARQRLVPIILVHILFGTYRVLRRLWTWALLSRPTDMPLQTASEILAEEAAQR